MIRINPHVSWFLTSAVLVVLSLWSGQFLTSRFFVTFWDSHFVWTLPLVSYLFLISHWNCLLWHCPLSYLPFPIYSLLRPWSDQEVNAELPPTLFSLFSCSWAYLLIKSPLIPPRSFWQTRVIKREVQVPMSGVTSWNHPGSKYHTPVRQMRFL